MRKRKQGKQQDIGSQAEQQIRRYRVRRFQANITRHDYRCTRKLTTYKIRECAL
jgi:sensor histidine kinase YesM